MSAEDAAGLDPTPERLPTASLRELADVLTGADITAAALAIDGARSPEQDARLMSWHGFVAPGLMVTPMQAQAGLVARERGLFAFNRLERHFLGAPEAWRHPDLAAGDYAARLWGEQVHAPVQWPFHQDCPVADWQLTLPPRWWSHGLVHGLVGFGWWEGLTEHELCVMARLDEMMASLHWYWLAELGRAYCPLHSVQSGDYTPDCVPCQGMEAGAMDPAVRAERIKSEQGRHIAANAVDILEFETQSYRMGIYEGRLIVPQAGYLAVGEACEYAKVHHQRLSSHAFGRWLEHCMVPEVDYATSPAGFEARCAEALVALLTPTAPTPVVSGARAQVVLRDVGARLCQGAALRGEPRGFERGLKVVAGALERLRGGVEAGHVEGLLGAALAEVCDELGHAEGAPGADEVLAVGYVPTETLEAEPKLMRVARRRALVRRAFASGAPIGSGAEGLPEVVDLVARDPRQPNLIEELTAGAVRAAELGLVEDFQSTWPAWLSALAHFWGGTDPGPTGGDRWYYRLARQKLPAEAEWGRYRLSPNPYLEKVPCPFHLEWSEQTLGAGPGETPRLEPRYTTAARYVMAGPGRQEMRALALTDARHHLWQRARTGPTVAELLGDGRVSRAELEAAIAEELLLCLSVDNPYARWPRPADWVAADIDAGAGGP